MGLFKQIGFILLKQIKQKSIYSSPSIITSLLPLHNLKIIMVNKFLQTPLASMLGNNCVNNYK